MTYQVKILPRAQRDFDQFSGKTFDAIKTKILELATDPKPLGTVKLTNEEGHRLRIGDYRVLSRIDSGTKTVFIYRIKHRKEAYE